MMLRTLGVLIASFARILNSRRDLLFENLTLRQRLAVLAHICHPYPSRRLRVTT
jgi:hypothetical protein